MFLKNDVAHDEAADQRSPRFRESENGCDDRSQCFIEKDAETDRFAMQIGHAENQTEALWPWLVPEEQSLNKCMGKTDFSPVDYALSESFDGR